MSADGPIEAGARIGLTVETPDGRVHRFDARVETVDPPTEVRWRERRRPAGLLDGDHVVELQRRGPEQTKVVHRARFEGLLVPLFERSGLTETRLGFEAMDRALKDRVESDAD